MCSVIVKGNVWRACFCFTSLSGVVNSELVVTTDNHFILLCQVLNLSGSVLNSLKGNRPIALDVKLLILKGLTLVAGSIKF